MTEKDEGRMAAPVSWQDWQRWVEGTDWSDWRSWLRRVAATDWAPGPWPDAPWEMAPRAGEVSLTLRAFAEDEPGQQMGEHLSTLWPASRHHRRAGQGPARGAHA